MDDDQTSKCWRLATTHFSPQEAAELRKNLNYPLSGTPWMASRDGRVVVAVPEHADRELALYYPYLAACLAEARRLGFDMVSFEADAGRVDNLPVHDAQAEAVRQRMPARRRLWLLRSVASELDLRGAEVEYAALHDEIAGYDLGPRILLVEPRQDDGHPARLTVHANPAAAARILEEHGSVAEPGERFIIDLATFARSAPVATVRWEDANDTVEVPLLCPGCGDPDVHEADKLLANAQGGWVERGTEREFRGNGSSDMLWDSQKADAIAPAFCGSCNWLGTPEELIPIYLWQAREEQSAT